MLTTVQRSSETSNQLPGLTASLSHVSGKVPLEIKQQSKSPVSVEKPKEPFYHVVFSTSCTAQQHWESFVLFYHAWKVKQPGSVTRLLSGCSTEDMQWMTEFHKSHIATMSPHFFVHFTPDFGKVTHNEKIDKQVPYKYMNKPFSLRHWLENALDYRMTGGEGNATFLANEKYDNDIVFLMDPDMILTKPLTHDFRDGIHGKNDTSLIWAEDSPPDDEHRFVHHGHPMSQQDGYLTSKWLKLDLNAVTLDPNNTIHKISNAVATKHWNSGPPYIMTARDAYRIAVHWTWYAPRVYKQFPQLFAEMFGYIIATAHLNLPHTFLKSLVVSTTLSRDREGWALVDQLDTVCPHPVDTTDSLFSHEQRPPLPFALHYCKRYLLGKEFWSKYRLRKDIMECHAPLLQEPNASIIDSRYSITPPPIKSIQKKGGWTQTTLNVSSRVAKREAFMLCGLTQKTNQALEYYKRRVCGDKGNYSKVYNTHTDPQ